MTCRTAGAISACATNFPAEDVRYDSIDPGVFPLRQQLSVEKHHPGGGRGPIGKVDVTMRNAPSAASPNWAPAFAGVGCWVGVWLDRFWLRLGCSRSSRLVSPMRRTRPLQHQPNKPPPILQPQPRQAISPAASWSTSPAVSPRRCRSRFPSCRRPPSSPPRQARPTCSVASSPTSSPTISATRACSRRCRPASSARSPSPKSPHPGSTTGAAPARRRWCRASSAPTATAT